MLHMPNVETFRLIQHRLWRDGNGSSDTKSSTNKIKLEYVNDCNGMDGPDVPWSRRNSVEPKQVKANTMNWELEQLRALDKGKDSGCRKSKTESCKLNHMILEAESELSNQSEPCGSAIVLMCVKLYMRSKELTRDTEKIEDGSLEQMENRIDGETPEWKKSNMNSADSKHVALCNASVKSRYT